MSRNTAGAGRRGISALAPHRHDPVLAALDAFVLIALAVLAGLHSGGTELGLGIAAAAAVVAALDMAGLYRPRLTLSALDDLPRLAGWSIVACALIVTVIRPGVEIGRAMLYTAAICFVLFALRVFYYAAVRTRRSRSGSRRMRSAVIGDGMIAVELIEATREQPGLGVDLVLAVSVDPMDELAATGVAIEQSGTGIRKLVDEYDIDALFVSFSSVPDSSLVSPLRECDELDCEIFVVPRLFEFTALNKDMDRIHTIPLIRLRRDAVRMWYWKLKRVFDLTLVSVALIVASPFLAGIACAVKISDPKAPILFRQHRIGRNGCSFDVLKFRSMRPVPAAASDSEWQPADADRIGTLGRFMRKTSLDELPQLWNVFRGDMSIVGPRPERPHFVEQFEGAVPSYADRHRVPVGLTGWAAVHGLRGDTSIADRALYDNFYIENWSIWLDIKIIVRTVGSVLKGTGG